MSKEEMKMIEALEMAREMSEYNDCPIYAFGNGENIKVVAKKDWFNEVSEKLENKGYWVVSIFENGHRVEC